MGIKIESISGYYYGKREKAKFFKPKKKIRGDVVEIATSNFNFEEIYTKILIHSDKKY